MPAGRSISFPRRPRRNWNDSAISSQMIPPSASHSTGSSSARTTSEPACGDTGNGGSARPDAAAARRVRTHARVIGVHARPEWAEPASFTLEGEPIRVVPCRSALEVRVELVERDDPAEWLVLLTDRDERDLGRTCSTGSQDDRLESIDSWSAVAASFEARGVDAALRRTPDLAGALLDHRPPAGYPPVAGSDTRSRHSVDGVRRACARSSRDSIAIRK